MISKKINEEKKRWLWRRANVAAKSTQKRAILSYHISFSHLVKGMEEDETLWGSFINDVLYFREGESNAITSMSQMVDWKPYWGLNAML